MSAFKSFWEQHFSDAYPVGFLLRVKFQEHWIRFHALPESKRYASSDAERAIVLERADALATATLGKSDCWVVASYPTDDWKPDRDFKRVRRNLQLEEAFSWRDKGEHETDQFEWTTCANIMQWTHGRFNELLLAIADDTGPNTIWISCKHKSIFAPYDGGFDLFLSDHDSIQHLRKKYAAWLSPRPDGL